MHCKPKMHKKMHKFEVRFEGEKLKNDMKPKRGLAMQEDSSFCTSVGAALFFIGIGTLFLLDLGLWPWALIVLGIASFPRRMSQGGLFHAIKPLVFFSVLTWFFLTGFGNFLPVIIIVIGVGIMLEGLSRRRTTQPV